MEVKINREIRDYTETMFFGLSMRQFLFALLAIGVALLVYFALRPHLDTETLSWLCILAAAPFGAAGFIQYHGMTCEQFAWVWIKSEILTPRRLCFRSTNIYYEALRPFLERCEREAVNRHD